MITFPVTQANFFSTLKVQSVMFRDEQPQEVSRLADGTILRASLGASLWRGTVTLAPSYHADAAPVEALLSVLQRAGSSFLIHDPRKVGPAADPAGTTLGAATPTILAVDADNRRMSIQGLPAGYVLTAGDMLSWQYGTSPTRYALHRLVSGATANAGGQTPLFEVTPLIRAGGASGQAVQLVQPHCKAVMASAPTYGEGEPLLTAGASFDFIQTLR